MVKGMSVVADRWNEDECFVREVLRSAGTMQRGWTS
ncbi:MAG: B12-binding domain-containing protein [Deltaproteobacteria bacterium]|nr:B12-binding domain-containing protein [Deltaproteobacteria bacterium]MBW2307151.1 B12-binding domain-containing protein [Deltaproteobacteria bacterium]